MQRNGNLKDYLTKLLSQLLHLIIALNYYGTKAGLELRGSCLKQDKGTFNHGKIVNFYIAYELDKTYAQTLLTLVNCLFGAVSITENADTDKNKYSGYGIGFDWTGVYLLPDGSFGRNIVIFGVDMSSSAHVDNKGKDIFNSWNRSNTRVRWAFINCKKIYSINLTDHSKKCCLSLHYNRTNNYLFVNSAEIIKFKAKDSNIIATPLCLGNISKDWSVDNMKDTGLNGYVDDFSVDYDAISVDAIKDIHNYLMKKNNIV